MTKIAISRDTLHFIESVFPPEFQASVVMILEMKCGFGVPFMNDAATEILERLHFAVLKLSKGSIDELTRAVDWPILIGVMFLLQQVLKMICWPARYGSMNVKMPNPALKRNCILPPFFF